MYKPVSPQGEAEPYFLSMFSIVLNDILCNNPTWRNTANAKYFSNILQCPQCEMGVWPFLQTSVRYRIQKKSNIYNQTCEHYHQGGCWVTAGLHF